MDRFDREVRRVSGRVRDSIRLLRYVGRAPKGDAPWPAVAARHNMAVAMEELRGLRRVARAIVKTMEEGAKT